MNSGRHAGVSAVTRGVTCDFSRDSARGLHSLASPPTVHTTSSSYMDVIRPQVVPGSPHEHRLRPQVLPSSVHSRPPSWPAIGPAGRPPGSQVQGSLGAGRVPWSGGL